MNEQLATAIGLKFVKKKKPGGGCKKADVCVYKEKTKYRFSFAKTKAAKLGDFAKIARANNRIYFVPSKTEDAYSYKFDKNKNQGTRQGLNVTFSAIGNIDEFVGDHDLKYFADLDAYYITAGE